ncbi:MAG: hypothetical protein LBJ00_06590 [Planctomycetaceae bacterium]|nr:hypothetical protein [Planctomycetaceae bacterium]
MKRLFMGEAYRPYRLQYNSIECSLFMPLCFYFFKGIKSRFVKGQVVRA